MNLEYNADKEQNIRHQGLDLIPSEFLNPNPITRKSIIVRLKINNLDLRKDFLYHTNKQMEDLTLNEFRTRILPSFSDLSDKTPEYLKSLKIAAGKCKYGIWNLRAEKCSIVTSEEQFQSLLKYGVKQFIVQDGEFNQRNKEEYSHKYNTSLSYQSSATFKTCKNSSSDEDEGIIRKELKQFNDIATQTDDQSSVILEESKSNIQIRKSSLHENQSEERINQRILSESETNEGLDLDLVNVHTDSFDRHLVSVQSDTPPFFNITRIIYIYIYIYIDRTHRILERVIPIR